MGMNQLFLGSVMFLHGLSATFSIVSAVIIASMISRGGLRAKSLRELKTFSVLLVVFSFATNITGTYGYLPYRLSSPDSPKSLILKTEPFAHEILFETMEYLGLIGPIWSVVIAWMIIYNGERAATDSGLRRTLLLLTILLATWTVAVAFTGIVPTMIAPGG
jgi:hypothetical protein